MRFKTRLFSRSKRDSQSTLDSSRADFLFTPLLDFCHQIQGFNPIIFDNSTTERETVSTVTVTSPRLEINTTRIEVTDITDTDTLKKENWFIPEVLPIRVSAVRKSDKAHFLFKVRHLQSAEITRTAGFELETVHIPKPSDFEGYSVSDARFVIDNLTNCKEGYELDNLFNFHSSKTDNPTNGVNLKIDVCKFDQYQNESLEWDSRTWLTRPGTISESMQLPKFRINSDTQKYKITTTPGKDESVDMTVVMGSTSFFFFRFNFYDRKTKEFRSDQCQLGFVEQGVKAKIECKSSKDSVQILRGEILDNSKYGSNDDENEVDASKIQREVTLRVTLSTASGKMTGYLFITSGSRLGAYSKRPIVQRLDFYRRIEVKNPNKQKVFPRRKIFMGNNEKSFQCDEEGNKYFPKNGKDCTLWCRATGRDLESITITKKHSKVPIFRNLTVGDSLNMYTMVDVGEVSPEIEGNYTCTVKYFRSFEQTRDLQLFTSGAPKIDTNKTTVIDYGNETSEIQCVVDGRLPMNINVSVYSVYTEDGSVMRVDNKTTSIRTETETGNGTILTVRLPTDDLRYPAISAQCQADSKFGWHNYQMYLPDFIQDHTLYEPKMVHGESGIANFKNGTTAITCTASAKAPMRIMIAIGGDSEWFRIDKEPGFVSVDHVTENGEKVIFYAPTQSLRRATSWLYCIAKNGHGRDSIYYNVRDYI